MDIYVDIETIGTLDPRVIEIVKKKVKAPSNYKDPDKISDYVLEHTQKAVDSTGLTPAGEIVCVGLAVDDDPPFAFVRQDSDSQSEYQLLFEVIEYLRELDKPGQPATPRFIGFNCIGFDLPRIWQRCAVRGLVLPSYFPAPWELSKWRPYGVVIDVMAAFDPNSYQSLEMMAALFGIEIIQPAHDFGDGKGERRVSGADVMELWLRGADDVIRDHCVEDVRITREIAKRMG